MLRSIGKQSGESVESVPKKKRKATVRRICRKEGFNLSLEWKSEGAMNDAGWWVDGTDRRSAIHKTKSLTDFSGHLCYITAHRWTIERGMGSKRVMTQKETNTAPKFENPALTVLIRWRFAAKLSAHIKCWNETNVSQYLFYFVLHVQAP